MTTTPLIIINNDNQILLKYLSTRFSINKLENSPHITLVNPIDQAPKIDDVRKLIHLSSYRSYDNSISYYLIHNFHNARHEAQNALLKILEEPPDNTQIIIISHQEHSILPTILSRCITVNLSQADNRQALSSQELELIDLIIDKKHLSYHKIIDLCDNYKDRSEAISLLEKLIVNLYKHLSHNYSHLSSKINILLTHLNYLHQNINVRLALENCFFQILK